MGKNVTLMGANYPDVPAVQLPQTGGGTATFYDVEVTDGDPTLAWGTRSKVGTVNGIDMHVTMPANPAPGVIDNLTNSSTTDALSANQGKELNSKISTLSDKIPDVPKIGKLLYSGTIAKNASSATITGISKYNLFMAVLNGNFINGPMYGVRFGAGEIRFFGCTLASGGAMSYSYLQMKVSGDNFIGWDTDGTYTTKWGDGTSGISNIYGIA